MSLLMWLRKALREKLLAPVQREPLPPWFRRAAGRPDGVVLANARAMGEFGAVYVVSGHIAGATDTMPLRVEKLFQEYRTPASMAVASVLAALALLTLVAKVFIERQLETESQELEAARAPGADTDPTTGGLGP